MADWGYDDLPQAAPATMPNQPSQAIPLVGGGIPQAPQMDSSVPLPGSAEERAQNFIQNNPDYQEAHKGLAKWQEHQGKAAKLDATMSSLLSQVGVNSLDENDAAANGLAEQAAGNFGGNGGLLTRMLTFHERQMAARHADARANAARGIQIVRMMNDLHEKGDQQQLEAVGKYIQMGGDAKDLVKEYGSQAQAEQRIQNAQNLFALRVQAEERHKADSEERRKVSEALIKAHGMLDPARQALLEDQALKLGIDLKSEAALRQAEINSKNVMAGEAPKRTQIMGAGATGLMPKNPQNLGLIPPPPTAEQMSAGPQPGAPPGAMPQAPAPVSFTPKFNRQVQNDAANNAAKAATTEKTNIETQGKQQQQRDDALYEADRQINKNKIKPSYWKGNKAWDYLSPKQKTAILQYAHEHRDE